MTGTATRYLYLARHGEASADETTLTESGRRQASLLGERLRDTPVSAIHHGPLPRARQTEDAVVFAAAFLHALAEVGAVLRGAVGNDAGRHRHRQAEVVHQHPDGDAPGGSGIVEEVLQAVVQRVVERLARVAEEADLDLAGLEGLADEGPQFTGVPQCASRYLDRRAQLSDLAVEHVADEAEQCAAQVGLALQGVSDRLDELGDQAGGEDGEQQNARDQRFIALLQSAQPSDAALVRWSGPCVHAHPSPALRRPGRPAAACRGQTGPGSVMLSSRQSAGKIGVRRGADGQAE
ncbi:histidine phosphatase family protein [Streptomyces sp. NPDC002405]